MCGELYSCLDRRVKNYLFGPHFQFDPRYADECGSEILRSTVEIILRFCAASTMICVLSERIVVFDRCQVVGEDRCLEGKLSRVTVGKQSCYLVVGRRRFVI